MGVKKFELGKCCNYTDIEKFVEENEEFTMTEYGQDYTGRGFIVLENDREDYYSFVSDGWSSNGTTYKCISAG